MSKFMYPSRGRDVVAAQIIHEMTMTTAPSRLVITECVVSLDSFNCFLHYASFVIFRNLFL